MRTSIVIRTWNWGHAIAKTLEAIFAQEYRDFEVVVVDSGSIDGTLDIVRQYEELRVIPIQQQDFSYGYAMNVGAQNSSGDCIVYLSQDAVPANEVWLSELLTGFEAPNVAGVYGRQIPYPDCPPGEKRSIARQYGVARRTQDTDSCFSSANAAVRRSLWQEFPFSEAIAFAEDRHWARLVQQQRHVIVYQPSAVVYHSHRETLTQVYRRSFLAGLGMAQGSQALAPPLYEFPLRVAKEVYQDTAFVLSHEESLVWIPRSVPYWFLRLGGFFLGLRRGSKAKAALL